MRGPCMQYLPWKNRLPATPLISYWLDLVISGVFSSLNDSKRSLLLSVWQWEIANPYFTSRTETALRMSGCQHFLLFKAKHKTLAVYMTTHSSWLPWHIFHAAAGQCVTIQLVIKCPGGVLLSVHWVLDCLSQRITSTWLLLLSA